MHAFAWDEPGPAVVPVVTASAGRVGPLEAVGAGLFRFRYHPPRLDQPLPIQFVGPRGAGAVELPSCPHPAGRIEVQSEPDRLMAGQGQKAYLRIQVQDAQGQALVGRALELTANVGRIETLEDLGGGSYRAVYVPPDDPYPQVAILMVANPAGARLERVAVARVVIPITARVELPGKTAPGTSMQMVVAGRRFGPVRADRNGRFSLPILVPPGFGSAEATSIDRVGNRKTRRISLFLPETNQLGLWAYPRRLMADGRSRSRLLVTFMDPFGALRDQADLGPSSGVRIQAQRGSLAELKHLQTGLYETYYTAPETIGDGRDRIEVSFPGGGSRSRAEVLLELLPGPATRVEFQVPDLLASDGQTPAALEVRVFDVRGNPVGREVVELTADEGTIRGLREVAPGVHRAELVAGPGPSKWSAKLLARVTDRKGTRSDRLMVTADGLRSTTGGGLELEAVLANDLGLPVSGGKVWLQTAGGQREADSDPFGRVRFALEPDGPAGPRACRLRAAGMALPRLVYWIRVGDSGRLLPIRLDEALPPASALIAQAQIRLHPPAPIQMSLFADLVGSDRQARRVRVLVVDANGTPMSGRKLSLSCSSGQLSTLQEVAAGEYQAQWRAETTGWVEALLSAVDQATQVGVVAHLQEGQAAP
jgi:hypothetical protein